MNFRGPLLVNYLFKLINKQIYRVFIGHGNVSIEVSDILKRKKLPFMCEKCDYFCIMNMFRTSCCIYQSSYHSMNNCCVNQTSYPRMDNCWINQASYHSMNICYINKQVITVWTVVLNKQVIIVCITAILIKQIVLI